MKPGNDLAVAGLPLSAGIATCEINRRTPVDRQPLATLCPCITSQIPPKREKIGAQGRWGRG
jgi:hypothetical protein